ncbi:MAG: hypothetical protein R3181_02785 [Rubricoccaceae bacterium]|nr:hypothetical protein [Rubricoccaceae bacterium]
MTRLALLLLPIALVACEVETPDGDDRAAADSTAGPYIHAASDVEAGRYYVVAAGCNDCHTPGFLENPAAVSEEQWLTGMPIGFRGPWGTSYAQNLRLRVQEMSEDQWVTRLQSPGLPPMPWHAVNHLSARDARAVYAYVRSLGPAGQPAPQALPPGQEPTTPYFDFTPQHMERMPSRPPGPPAPADSARVPADTLASTV